MGITSPTCFFTWTFICIKASSPEDNQFVGVMRFMSPTCFTTFGGQAWEMKEGCGGIGKMKEEHSKKLVVESGVIQV